MFTKRTIKDIDLAEKIVLVRVDFNVPLENGRVADNNRIKAAKPTLDYLRDKGAKIILISHLGRPKGKPDSSLSLNPVAEEFTEVYGKSIFLNENILSEDIKIKINQMKPGEITLLENIRFYPGEEKNDLHFAKNLAGMADIFVNDAFGTAHRSHASTVGVTEFLPAVGGFLLEKEVNILSSLIENPEKPFYAILGGNKVSDKIGVIDKFLDIVDGLFTGGGMCFTFLKAKDLSIGKSLFQDSEFDHSKEMLAKAEDRGGNLFLPQDVVVAEEISKDAEAKNVPVDKIPDDMMGLDIGPVTIKKYTHELEQAKTIFWNGPMGVFEIEQFAKGTKAIARTLADSEATTIVGGGDSDLALRKFDLEDKISFISTGGGASLKLLEGKPMPGVEALDDKT